MDFIYINKAQMKKELSDMKLINPAALKSLKNRFYLNKILTPA